MYPGKGQMVMEGRETLWRGSVSTSSTIWNQELAYLLNINWHSGPTDLFPQVRFDAAECLHAEEDRHDQHVQPQASLLQGGEVHFRRCGVTVLFHGFQSGSQTDFKRTFFWDSGFHYSYCSLLIVYKRRRLRGSTYEDCLLSQPLRTRPRSNNVAESTREHSAGGRAHPLPNHRHYAEVAY